MSATDEIKASIKAIRKAFPRYTNIATTEQSSTNERDTILVLGQLADMLETQLAALDARVTALE